MKVILIGMPGSGKTEAGEALAKRRGMCFFDTDQLIQNKGISIAKIFNTLGEQAFRDIETDVLLSVLKWDNAVISTGGGIVTRDGNIKMIRNSGIIIFIDRPVELIAGNIETANRPLLSDAGNLHRLYEKRIQRYQESCHIAVKNDSSFNILLDNLERAVKTYENIGD